MKKTQAIKERLNTHRDMLEKLDAMKEELEYVYGSIKGSNLSGMPGGGGYKGTSEPEVLVRRKMELEEKVQRKEDEVDRDWADLEPMIESLKPIETLILNLRYRYGEEWEDVCFTVFGKRSDYLDEIDCYMNKMFKAHGRALLELADMTEEKTA